MIDNYWSVPRLSQRRAIHCVSNSIGVGVIRLLVASAVKVWLDNSVNNVINIRGKACAGPSSIVFCTASVVSGLLIPTAGFDNRCVRTEQNRTDQNSPQPQN
eukprot:CAMPEP_0168180652 /NCGR_PEP_ID=MMETSP0139_2-20121125/10677_1 /TAXON_ID=44445 /ORGANISM="Pseudo-nitzschia australis, Strain 10249 10 AB" /LENGTH=101 /DNA_ID=CAMNT_0008100935 /DNA_START=360 /DNA_END=665 /DNA_ORIENTATION=+